MLYSHNKHALYVACGRGWLDEYYNDLWMYDFRQDLWKQMDQTHISILPEPRHGAFGGTYPAYEEANAGAQGNFYLAHGSSQFFMHQTMYAYMFTDAYGLNGIWEKCKCGLELANSGLGLLFEKNIECIVFSNNN